MIVCSHTSIAQYQWPFPNPNVQGQVVGSVGEVRDVVANPRFHKGVDLTNGDNYAVHSINSGTASWNGGVGLNSSITVTSTDGVPIVYWHVDPVDGVGTTKTQISICDYIGNMGSGGARHVHLERSNTNFLDNNLSPYVDLAPPFFVTTHIPNGIAFYRNGLLRNTTDHGALQLNQQRQINGVNHTTVYNKIDIVAHAGDSRTGSDGNGRPEAEGRNLPAVISWRLKNSANTIVGSSELNFEGIPVNAAALSSFHPLSLAAGTPYISIHIITSHPTTQPYDRFLNTGLKTGQTENWSTNATTPARPATLDARLNAEALYPDGKYVMEINAHDVDFDSNPNLSAPQQTANLVIDNFRPYVKQVVVSKYSALGSSLAYDGYWQWNQSLNQLEKIQTTINPIGPIDRAYIKIIMSEPCSNVRVNVPAADGSNYYAATSINDKEFYYLVNQITTSGTQQINIQAEDLAGNPLQTNPAQIPIRQPNGTWGTGVSPGIDAHHYFNTGTGTCAGAGGRTTTTGCMYADISSSTSIVAVNGVLTFTPVVSGSGVIRYNWNFGAGATPATSTSSGIQNVIYSTSGVKTVSLEICDNSGECITTTKTDFVSVGTSQPTLNVDFSTNRYGAGIGENIQLTSAVSGAIGNVSYSWEFGGEVLFGHFSDINPLIAYNSSGNKTISLTVTDAVRSVTKTKNSYINVNSNAFSISSTIFGCVVTGADGRASFSASVTGGNGPPYDSYLWDFGDGNSSNSTGIISHTYTKSGQYTVRLTVCDETGCATSEIANCVTVPHTVEATTLTPRFLVEDILLNPNGWVGVQVGLNTPVTLTDATTGGGDPNTFSYRWQLEGAKPYNEYTTKGPQEVYYDAVGGKNVKLTVVNSTVARSDFRQNAIDVVAGLGSGRCFATIGEPVLSSACWNAQSIPQFTIPVSKSNCPIAKTEVIYFSPDGSGYVLPNNKLDFSGMGIAPPQFPFTADFSFMVYQFDGVSYNRIGYKRQKFTIYGPVIANAGTDKNVCVGGTALLGGSSSNEFDFSWTGNGSTLNFLNSTAVPNPVFSGIERGTYTYNLKVTDRNTGCESTVDKVIVKVDNPTITPTSFTLPLNEDRILSVNTANGFGGNEYSWYPETFLNNPMLQTPTFRVSTEGEYNYEVTVTDQNGCRGTSQVSVDASNAAGDMQIIPSSFSHVRITWQDRSSDETGFLIQRSIGNSLNFTDLVLVAANTTVYDDYSVQPGVNYYYRVITIFPTTIDVGNYSLINTGSLPAFTEIQLPFWGKSFAYADLNNDGFLDCVANTGNMADKIETFLRTSNGEFLSKSIINNQEKFSLKLADINNDNSLDLLAIPWSNHNQPLLISTYKNGFVEYLSKGSHSFAQGDFYDYNRDNTVDLMVVGLAPEFSSGGSLGAIQFFRYQNINGQLTKELTGLDARFINYRLLNSEVTQWVDLNNDGVLEMITMLAQNTSPSGTVIDLVKYDLSGQEYLNASKQVLYSAYDDSFVTGGIAIGDVNNDGRIDIGINSSYHKGIMYNQANGSLAFSILNTLPKVESSFQFGDFNQDGFLDFFVSQTSPTLACGLNGLGSVFVNNRDGSFSEVFSRTVANCDPMSKWIDFDGDGDLDIITTSNTVLINNLGTNDFKQNSPPSNPQNLCSYLNGNQLTFSWDAANDAESKVEGLTYNIFVKLNGEFIITPLADVATGFRKVVQRGNVDHNRSWTITLPSTSGNIEWGVQAIDNQLKGGKFSTEFINLSQDVSLCKQVTSHETFVASNILTPANCSPTLTTVTATGSLNLFATQSIRLLPGFTVEAGGVFSAKVNSSVGTIPCQTISNGRTFSAEDMGNFEGENSVKYDNELIEIFPNPTTGIVKIVAEFNVSRVVSIAVIDVHGKALFTKNLGMISQLDDLIDLSNLPEGVYFVKVYFDGISSIRRVVKY